jgi:hypothetical protein
MSRESFLKGRRGNLSSVSHKRAPLQEKTLARRLNGNLVPGSGSSYLKGDVRVKGVCRIEAKTTKRKSFSVTREMVRKIEDAATPHGEVPAIVVEFLDENGHPESELLVMPSYAIDALTGEQ